MVLKKSLIILLVNLSALSESAFARNADSIPLQFQADKNNIQILPQRFEYNLVDEDHIKIGDIVIDSTTFGFQISSKPEANGKFRARFIWPAGLLKDGTLTIRDNTGKSIWSVTVSRQNTRVLNSAPHASSNPKDLVRNQLTEFITDQFEVSKVEDMKFLPFMNFCITRKTLDTNVYLCSKELYLGSQGKLAIRSRAQGRRQAFVEINGRNVGKQGTIFLNDEKENIGFRAMTQSGAILEVETRMKPVDFKDAVLSSDGNSLILTASGAEPVNEDRVKRISDEEWQYEVDPQRPILYVKGEGGIPMRQEFYVKGKLPEQSTRPYLAGSAARRVYKSSVRLEVEKAQGTRLSTADASQTLEKVDDRISLWTVADIPNGQTSRHYLKVAQGDATFTAAYDVYREYAFEAGAIGSFGLPSSQADGHFHVNWWIENLFGIQENWSRLHWGLRAEQMLNLIRKDGEMNLNISKFELIWRANSGFHYLDATWGLRLPFEFIQATGFSTVSPGVGAFFSSRPPAVLQKWMPWYDVRFTYLFGGSGSVKLNNAVQIEGLAYYHKDSRFSWNYGLGLTQYSFDGGSSKMQLRFLGGASYRF